MGKGTTEREPMAEGKGMGKGTMGRGSPWLTAREWGRGPWGEGEPMA